MNPSAARLSNVLNKRVTERFSTQAEPTTNEIGVLAAESYLQAGAALYALAKFDEAANMAEKAVKLVPGEARHRFFLAKYLVRSGNYDAAVPQLQEAIEIVPAMALGAVADFDLNKTQPIMDLLIRLDTELTQQLQGKITVLRDWPADGYQHQKIQQLIADSQDVLTRGNYAEKVSFLTELTNWQKLMPYLTELAEIAAALVKSISNAAEAVKLLQEKNPRSAEEAWAKRVFKGYCLSPELKKFAVKTEPTFTERVLLATADGQYRAYDDENLIEQLIKIILTTRSTDGQPEAKSPGTFSQGGKALVELW